MPIFPAYNADGSVATAAKGAGAQTDGYAYAFQGIENPLALAQRVNITRKGLRATYNGSASYEIIKNLVAKLNLGGSTYNEKYEYYYPTNLSSGINPPGSSQAILAAIQLHKICLHRMYSQNLRSIISGRSNNTALMYWPVTPHRKPKRISLQWERKIIPMILFLKLQQADQWRVIFQDYPIQENQTPHCFLI